MNVIFSNTLSIGMNEKSGMNSNLSRSAGFALIIASACLLVTMLLHPAGGNIELLLKEANTIIVSHSLAICAVPFFLAGFWGFTKQLGKTSIISATAFSMMAVAQLAGIIAAAINGLATPMFVDRIQGLPDDQSDIVRLILKASLSLNNAFDFIFLVTSCFAIFVWSVLILRVSGFWKIIGYYGIIFSTVIVCLLPFGLVNINLHTFRLSMAAYLLWTILLAINLMRLSKTLTDDRNQ